MGNRLARCFSLLPALLRSAMFLPASIPMIANASQIDLTRSDNCAQRIRVIDDQADLDVRAVNQEIVRLRLELAASSGTATNAGRESAIQIELTAAQARKKDTLRDHHSALNDVRAECDILRAAARQATRDASSSAINR